jgi:pSer/pThr/pTyr-binding forkhead associated (FHA) protein
MAITIELMNGKRVSVLGDSATIGRAPAADFVVQSPELRPIHAKITRVAGKWMVESEGDWLLQVGDGVPGRKHWLQPGRVIRLTESGVRVIFEPTVPTQPAPPSTQKNAATMAQKAETAVRLMGTPAPTALQAQPYPSLLFSQPLPCETQDGDEDEQETEEQDLKRAVSDFCRAAMTAVPTMLANVFRERRRLVLGFVAGVFFVGALFLYARWVRLSRPPVPSSSPRPPISAPVSPAG